MGIGYYDPDGSNFQGKRPAWATPKTQLAKDALAACGRKYFHGNTKHDSEYERFNVQETRAMGANNECYLYKKWIESCVEWAKSKNIQGLAITFPALLNLLENDERRNDWHAQNRTRLIEERKNNIPTEGIAKVSNEWFSKQFEEK